MSPTTAPLTGRTAGPAPHRRTERTTQRATASAHRAGLGLLGRLVEAAILSPREGRKELGRLKALIESDLKA